MKKLSFAGVVLLGALLVALAGISPAVGEFNKSSGNERPVAEALGTISPENADWATAWEYFGVVETGMLQAAASGGETGYELRGTEIAFPVGFILGGPIETGALPEPIVEESWMKEYGHD